MAANEPLRKAMADARITIEALGRAAGVHPKTVQRWLAGRVPHPRHRWAIADLLGVREEALWPTARPGAISSMTGTSEILAAYAHRAEVPSHVWRDLFDQAKTQIDLLAYAMLFLPEANPRLVDQLKEKAAAGCTIRIALAHPDSAAVADRDQEEGLGGALPARIRYTLHYLADVSEQDGISLRLHATPMYNSVFRFDDEMLVTPTPLRPARLRVARSAPAPHLSRRHLRQLRSPLRAHMVGFSLSSADCGLNPCLQSNAEEEKDQG
jgi:lambda repressor-like predicted transcriptional regulator